MEKTFRVQICTNGSIYSWHYFENYEQAKTFKDNGGPSISFGGYGDKTRFTIQEFKNEKWKKF